MLVLLTPSPCDMGTRAMSWASQGNGPVSIHTCSLDCMSCTTIPGTEATCGTLYWLLTTQPRLESNVQLLLIAHNPILCCHIDGQIDIGQGKRSPEVCSHDCKGLDIYLSVRLPSANIYFITVVRQIHLDCICLTIVMNQWDTAGLPGERS